MTIKVLSLRALYSKRGNPMINQHEIASSSTPRNDRDKHEIASSSTPRNDSVKYSIYTTVFFINIPTTKEVIA